MKALAILFLSCLCAWGQASLLTGSGIDWTSASATTFDPTTFPGLWLYLATDRTTSITNAADATSITGWTNIAPVWTPLGRNVFNSSGTAMTFKKPGPTASIGAVDFTCNTCPGGNDANVKWMGSGVIFGTNAPVTWYIVLNTTNDWDRAIGANKTQLISDSTLGGRPFHGIDGNAGWIQSYNGSFLTGANNTFTTFNQWCVIAFVDNGASSAIYTNGVLYLSGNVNTTAAGVGLLRFGTDSTDVTQLMAKVACILSYAAVAHTSGNVATISAGLKARFSLP